MKTKIINRRGELIDLDDNAIIPDGYGVRVPIMLQDAAPDATHLTDALGREAGHRPGHVYASDANEAAARAAHNAYQQCITDAWRGTEIAKAAPEPADISAADPDAVREAYKQQLSEAWQTPSNVSFNSGFGS